MEFINLVSINKVSFFIGLAPGCSLFFFISVERSFNSEHFELRGGLFWQTAVAFDWDGTGFGSRQNLFLSVPQRSHGHDGFGGFWGKTIQFLYF